MKRSEKIFFSVVFVLLFLVLFVPLVGNWGLSSFGHVTMDEVMFQLRMPLQGTNPQYFREVVCQCLLPALLGAAVLGGLLLFGWRWAARCQHCVQLRLPRRRRPLTLLPRKVPKTVIALVCIALLGGSLAAVGKEYQLGDYLKSQVSPSPVIEEHYVAPTQVSLQFPAQKRNLIYIYLESMETTYMDAANGGAFSQNYIPELTALARDNTAFTSPQTGGAQVTPSAGWTTAGMFAHTSGLPLKLPAQGNPLSEPDGFFPAVTALGDLLAAQGYRNYFCLGSDAEFGGRADYLTQHGDYTILDYPAAIEEGKLPADYYVWWGHEDQKLFSFAKEYLSEIAQQEQPFNFTMLTVDTHAPDGYRCELCGDEYDSQYADVLACNSRQVAAFVDWVAQQPFYENTTVVLCGDHCSMNPDFFDNLPAAYQRTVYNAFLNAPLAPAKSAERTFTTLDLFPTTLASLGVTIEGERLGLGTNLFSERETLAEEVGLSTLNRELAAKSTFYNRELLYKKKSP